MEFMHLMVISTIIEATSKGLRNIGEETLMYTSM